MTALSRLFTGIFSLYDPPFGADKFSTGLTLSFCLTAKMGLDRKFGNGGFLKGPATNLSKIQEAIVSVSKIPCSNAEGEFGHVIEGSCIT